MTVPTGNPWASPLGWTALAGVAVFAAAFLVAVMLHAVGRYAAAVDTVYVAFAALAVAVVAAHVVVRRAYAGGDGPQ